MRDFSPPRRTNEVALSIAAHIAFILVSGDGIETGLTLIIILRSLAAPLIFWDYAVELRGGFEPLVC